MAQTKNVDRTEATGVRIRRWSIGIVCVAVVQGITAGCGERISAEAVDGKEVDLFAGKVLESSVEQACNELQQLCAQEGRACGAYDLFCADGGACETLERYCNGEVQCSAPGCRSRACNAMQRECVKLDAGPAGPPKNDIGPGVPPVKKDIGPGVPPVKNDIGPGVPPVKKDMGPDLPPPCDRCQSDEICVQHFDGNCVHFGPHCVKVSEQCRAKLVPAGAMCPADCDAEYCGGGAYQCQNTPPCGTEAPGVDVYCYGP